MARLGSLVLKLAIFLPLPAFCQGRTVSVAKIPFRFAANGHILPAGEYFLHRDSENIYSLRTRSGATASRFMVYGDTSSTSQQRSKLVFRVSATGYYLDSAWTEGSRDGIRVVNPRPKKEVAAVPTGNDTAMVASEVQIPLEK
ncbi:hypothetical protein [Terriglobus aquaticus]|uniref:DUF2846 domain-containing protein n=2 Tax=Terriglobus aquaticus TaxID=940139 RepID=A0ABW9KIP4_9BACT